MATALEPDDDGLTMPCGSSGGALAPATTSSSTSRSTSCVKCSTAESVSLTPRSYCPTCFVDTLRHRVQGASVRCGLRYGVPVALGLSGGASSTFLLSCLTHLSPSGPPSTPAPTLAFRSPNVRKNVFTSRISCVFVDTTALDALHSRHYSDDDSRRAVCEVMQAAHLAGRPFVHTRLEDVFLPEPRFVKIEAPVEGDGESDAAASSARLLPVDPDAKAKLAALFEGITTTDARQDVLESLTQRCLVSVSDRIGCSHLLLGTTRDRLAGKAIDLISKARGYALPIHIALLEWHIDGINVGKPLRDTSITEATHACHLIRSPTTFFPSFTTKAPSVRDSITGITDTFLATLTASFVGTTSKVVATCGKLKPFLPLSSGNGHIAGRRKGVIRDATSESLEQTEAMSHRERLCPLCLDPMPRPSERPIDPTDWPTSPLPPAHSDTDTDTDSKTTDSTASLATLRETVCRACVRILSETREESVRDAMPPRVLEQSDRVREWTRREMKESIGEFLLDDDDDDDGADDHSGEEGKSSAP